MKVINFDYNKTSNFFNEQELNETKKIIIDAHNKLHNRNGEGSEFTGWLDWPLRYDKNELARIKIVAEKIRNNSDVLVVVGIGGPYLGARVGVETLSSYFGNKKPLIIYVGNSFSSTYLTELLDFIKDKEVSINVISKSGTTLETSIAFDFLKSFMEDKYGKDKAKERIYVTTSSNSGHLNSLAKAEGYETFTIPDDIGGRYGVLTSMGMLPMAVCGIDIDRVMDGAKDAMSKYDNVSFEENECYQYAAIRNILYKKGKQLELLATYEPNMHYFGEWWKQLFGESEGKDGKGLFPVSISYSTDLHSLGQYVQDGPRTMFETVLKIDKPIKDLIISTDDSNINYLNGRTLSYVNEKVLEATVLAHHDGGVPNLLLSIPKMDEYYFGYLIYFFQKACAISGYILGVNPFNQPGVEAYKKNMFRLLGK